MLLSWWFNGIYFRWQKETCRQGVRPHDINFDSPSFSLDTTFKLWKLGNLIVLHLRSKDFEAPPKGTIYLRYDFVLIVYLDPLNIIPVNTGIYRYIPLYTKGLCETYVYFSVISHHMFVVLLSLSGGFLLLAVFFAYQASAVDPIYRVQTLNWTRIQAFCWIRIRIRIPDLGFSMARNYET